MKLENALSFFIIYHLQKDKSIPLHQDIINEMATSLCVKLQKTKFIISFQKNEKNMQFTVPRNEIYFYKLSTDKTTPQQLEMVSKENQYFLEKFINFALESKNSRITTSKRKASYRFQSKFFSYTHWRFFSYVLYSTLTILFFREELIWFSVIIPLCFAIEFWGQKRALMVPLFLLPLMFAFPMTFLWGQISYLLFNFLDSNRNYKSIRLLIPITVVIISIFINKQPTSTPIQYSVYTLIFVLISSTCFLIKSLYGSHFRFFPLAFPFLCIGIYLDGHVYFAYTSLGWYVLSSGRIFGNVSKLLI